MDKNRLLELLIKKEAKEISLAEQVELSQILEQDAYKETAEKINEIFSIPISFEKTVDASAVNRRVESLLNKIEYKKPKATVVRLIYKKIAVAAVLLIALSLTGVYYFGHSSKSGLQNIVSTKKGSKSNIFLPDGTQVWINADTRLTYDKSFGENTREVNLEGEAFFDVVKDKNRPFIVHTQTMDVRVVGTAFNVRAYNNEASTQATLVRGLVEVILNKKNSEKITLRPNEKITVQNQETKRNATTLANTIVPEIVLSKIALNPVDSSILETQWMKSHLQFDQEELVNIIPMLENWYNVKITVTNPALLHRRFSGKIENESLTETLEVFRLASGLNYKTNKNNVTIYK